MHTGIWERLFYSGVISLLTLDDWFCCGYEWIVTMKGQSYLLNSSLHKASEVCFSSWYTCTCECTHMDCRVEPWMSFLRFHPTYFFETSFLAGLELTKYCPEIPRLPNSTSSMLGLQVHTMIFIFWALVLGIKLMPSCLNRKHFTQWSHPYTPPTEASWVLLCTSFWSVT